MIKLKHKRMRYVGEFDSIEFYEYSPTLFHPYYMDYPKQDHPHYETHIAHRIRMITEYLRGGYRVYYMVADGALAGHIVVAKGDRRLKISRKEDIVVGPIYVTPSMRGKGIGTTGIGVILNKINLEYNYAYEFIAIDNITSIRTVEKNGYEYVGRAKEVGLMKNIVECADGDYVVYRYKK